MRAGFARADITCRPPTPLGGNARSDKAARDVHDPLFANVAVLESDDGTVTVLIGCDLLAVPASLVDAFTVAISAAAPITPRQVVVFATHTHSGPDVTHGLGFEDHDFALVDDWLAEAAPLVATAVSAALASLAPATMELRRTRVAGVAFNRRLQMVDGSTRMNWEGVDPSDVVGVRGPVDDELVLVIFRNAVGAPIGSLVHFTLHPAVLVGHEWLVSADYVASLAAGVSRWLGGVPVLFANGALGNINHLDFADQGRAIGFAEADRIGEAIASAAISAGSAGSAAPMESIVRLERIAISVPQRTVSPDELERARQLIVDTAGHEVDSLDGIPPAAYARWLVARGPTLAPDLVFEASLLDLGDLTLVLLPFEVFVEFGIDLRAAFPDRVVRVVSLAGDYLGYLPTAAAFREGGYEPTLGTSTVAPGAGELIVEELTRTLARLKEEATHDL